VSLPILLPAAGAADGQTANGQTIDGQSAGGGSIGAGAQIDLVIAGRGGVPASGVTAVVLNVTATEPTAASYITVWPSGVERPVASNLNLTPGTTVANTVVTGLSADGRISVYNNAGSANVVVDVQGWFAPGQGYTAVTPARLADTRGAPTIDSQFAGEGHLPPGGSYDLQVVGRGGVPADGVGAVVLNVAATNPTATSYVTVWPKGEDRPLASNLNVAPGITTANVVVAKVGADGAVSMFNNNGDVDLVVDVVGWFATGDSYTPLTPTRLLDSRQAEPLNAGTPIDVSLAGQAGLPESELGAVALNVTITEPAGAGYLTIWPTGVDRPTSSNLDFVAGRTIANSVMVKVGAEGRISLFAPTTAHVVIDVMGWYGLHGPFIGLTPARVVDTRDGVATPGGPRPSDGAVGSPSITGPEATLPIAGAPATTLPITTTPPAATTPPPAPATTVPSGPVKALTPGTSWQWQIDGGPIDMTVLDGVANPKKMFDIDMETTSAATIAQLHAKGIYVVCYMETGAWEKNRSDAGAYPASVLGSVMPGYPGERFVDIRRTDIVLPILAKRLDAAAAKGCDGIEPDLDDTYTYNTGFPITMAQNVSFNKAVADLSHARGMSIGLKNGASGGAFESANEPFTDWALNEECNQYDECDGYEVYIAAGKAVFQVEYSESGTTTNSFCPADNAANFDGLLKKSSETLGARPRTACRGG
jgi:hypothetical protein